MSKKEFKIITSWDDYSQYNGKLAELLYRYNLPAIFFIECSHPKHITQITKLHKGGFEIGGHTVQHTILRDQTKEIVEWETKTCKMRIEEITKTECKWFAYPRGRHDKEARDIVKEVGFKFARTTLVLNKKTDDPMQTSTSVHVFQRKEYEGVPWQEVAVKELKRCRAKKETFHLWGHAQEIENYDYWHKLEEIFKLLAEEL